MNGTIHVIGGSGDHRIQNARSWQLPPFLLLERDADDCGVIFVHKTLVARPENSLSSLMQLFQSDG